MEISYNKKPLIITLAALACIIIATVAVTLILRGRAGTRFSGDGDAPYPYSWVEKKNGEIVLTIETGDAKNSAWSLEDTGSGTVEVRAGKTKGGKTSVTITPEAVGREIMTFSLTSEEERLAELSFSVLVTSEDDALSATVTDHRERAFQGAVRGGEETGHPFTVRGGDDGLTIFVEESEGYTDGGTAWESESDNIMTAYVSNLDVSNEGVTIRLETRANGSAEVRVFSVRENISFVFDVEVKNGEMTLTDSRWEPYEAEEETTDEAQEAESEAQP